MYRTNRETLLSAFRLFHSISVKASISPEIATFCGSPEKLKDYFALSIYRMAVCAANGGYIPKKWISLDCEASPVFGSVLMTEIIRDLMSEANPESQKNIAEPKCVKTVVEHSEKLIRKRAAELAAEKSRG